MSRQIYGIDKDESIKVGRDSIWCGVSLGNIINFASIKGFSLEDWVGNWLNYGYEKKK